MSCSWESGCTDEERPESVARVAEEMAIDSSRGEHAERLATANDAIANWMTDLNPPIGGTVPATLASSLQQSRGDLYLRRRLQSFKQTRQKRVIGFVFLQLTDDQRA